MTKSNDKTRIVLDPNNMLKLTRNNNLFRISSSPNIFQNRVLKTAPSTIPKQYNNTSNRINSGRTFRPIIHPKFPSPT